MLDMLLSSRRRSPQPSLNQGAFWHLARSRLTFNGCEIAREIGFFGKILGILSEATKIVIETRFLVELFGRGFG